ncbi:MAG: hypothetical protein ACYDBH_01705 [Acidobacteriaceae bacterium]
MKRHIPPVKFRWLIDDLGGYTTASKRLGIPRPTLYCIGNGHRRLSLDMAKLIAERSGHCSPAELLDLTP